MSPATIPADIEMLHQPCRDKIAALRSVARALEAENELLLKENENNRRHSQSIAGRVTNTTIWICFISAGLEMSGRIKVILLTSSTQSK